MRWIKYPNITLFALSVATAIVLSWLGIFDSFSKLGEFDYLGAFIAGFLWPFTFAAPLSAASFFYLGQTINIWTLIIVGSAGALISDILITKVFKGGIFVELEKIWQLYERNHHRRFSHEHKPHLIELFHSRPFHFLAPFLGVVVLFSPLPDELGLELLAYYRLRGWKLVLLSIASSATAIWLVVSAGQLALG